MREWKAKETGIKYEEVILYDMLVSEVEGMSCQITSCNAFLLPNDHLSLQEAFHNTAPKVPLQDAAFTVLNWVLVVF